MALPLAPAAILRAALTRAVQLNLSAGAVQRSLNRAGFSTRGLNLQPRFRTETARKAQRDILAGLRGNAKPRPGSGMSGRPIQALTRYSYVGEIAYRMPGGEIVTRTQSVLSNELLSKSQAQRLLLEQAQQLQLLGRTTKSGLAAINAQPVSATLQETFANQV